MDQNTFPTDAHPGFISPMFEVGEKIWNAYDGVYDTIRAVKTGPADPSPESICSSGVLVTLAGYYGGSGSDYCGSWLYKLDENDEPITQE